MLRRISAILIILGGLALIVVPVVDHVWSGSPPAHAMINSFKPVMTTASMQVIQTDLQQLSAANHQLTTEAIPALAGQLHMTPAQLQQAMSTNFSAVATGVAAMPSILAHFDGFATLIRSQLVNFQQASTIPISGMPITVMPWAFTLVGLLVLVFGVGMLTKKGKGSAVAALVLGLAIVLGSVALSFPQKAVSADHMITGLKPIMTTQSVSSMTQSLDVVAAMTNQMNTQMFPYVASQLKMTPAAFNTFMGSQFPDVGTALKNMPTTSAMFSGMRGKIAGNLTNYQRASAIPSMTFLIWLLVGVGGIGILGGVAGLVGASDENSGSGSDASSDSEKASAPRSKLHH